MNRDKRVRLLAASLGLLLMLGGIAPAQAEGERASGIQQVYAAPEEAGEELSPEQMASESEKDAEADASEPVEESAQEKGAESGNGMTSEGASAEDIESTAGRASDEDIESTTGSASNEEPETEAENDTREEESAEEYDPNLDYILGRPMTEEEIAAQRALEPDFLPVIPMLEDQLGLDREEDLDPDDLTLASSLYATLPASYDARESSGAITPVKNQLPYGSCWAFAALASGEASLIRRGAVVNGSVANASNLDLSELQLLYFFYHPLADALGNTAGDSVAPLNGTYLWKGGHGIFTTFALSSWIGAAAEPALPYSLASEDLTPDADLCRESDVAHMQNAYWVLMSDRDGVKSLIREYSSVAVSFYWQTNGYNRSTGAYNNTTYKVVNHAVNLVGWDDNYSRDNFVEAVRPASDGAWLVKNNWGSDWGDQGYFWISYEDVSLTGSGSTAFGYVYDFEAADNYDHIYQYDGSWSYNKTPVSSGRSVANVFTVSGSEKEELRAVSVSLFTANVEYSLQIYRDPPSGDPTGGTPMLEEPQEGWLPCAGYHTIELEQPGVRFLKGETFSVVFTLSTADGEEVRVLSDATGTNGDWIRFVNATQPGQSYINNSGSWMDLGTDTSGNALGTSGITARVKAFTTDWVPVPIEGVTLSDTALSLRLGSTAELTAQLLPADTTEDRTVRWTSSDPTVVTVENGQLNALSVGTAVITAEAGEANVTATCQVEVYWVPIGTVTLNKTTLDLQVGKTASLTAQILPENTTEDKAVRWRSSNTAVATVVNGQVKAVGRGSAVITAEAGEAGVTARCTVSVRDVGGPDRPALRSMVRTGTGLKVRWNKVTCDGYRIYRKEPGGKWTAIANTEGSRDTITYNDTTAQAGVTYIYTVCAYNYVNGAKALSDYDAAGVSMKK